MYKYMLLLILILSNYSSAALDKVSLQLMWHHQFQFAGFYMAKEKGFFKDENLDVEFKKFNINLNIVDEVINNKATFGTSSSNILIEKSKGKDITLLSAIFQSSPLVLLGIKSPSLNTLNDMTNKKIMVTKERERLATLNMMIKSQGIKLDTLKYLNHSFNIEDLINKKTDLMLAYTINEPFLLKEKGYEPIIFSPKDYGFDFYEELVFTSSAFAKKNPQIVRRFKRAIIKGWIYTFNNIPESVKLTYEKYNPMNKSIRSLLFEANEMKKLVFAKDGSFGELKKDKLQFIIQSYIIMGLMNTPIDTDDLLFEESLGTLNKKEAKYLKQKKTIRMCVDPNWMPFEKISNEKHVGMSADYIKLLEKKLGTTVKLVPSKSWTESIELGRKRDCDIFSLITVAPKYSKFLDFTTSYVETPLVIATNTSSSFISDLSHIKGEKIALVKDYAYAQKLKIKHSNINFIMVDNIKEGLEKVDKDEIFAVIGALATIGYQIQRNYIGQLKIAGKFDEKVYFGIGTRKDIPILKDIFNKGISQIKENEHQIILNKWMPINYHQGVQYQTIWKYIIISIVIVLLLILIYRQYLLKDLNRRLNKKVKQEIEKNSKQYALLSQQTKMAAMGEMLANIAHQWRQPLSLISTASTGLKLQKELGKLSDENFEKSLDAINDSAQYLSKTIDDFRNFFNKNKEKQEVTINSIIEQSLTLTSSQFVNHSIIIKTKIDDILIYTYVNELIQAIINILNNSKDALLNSKSKRVISIIAYKIDSNLIIKIKDNAGGIKEDIISRIFEPYFTTKHKFQGTGIGLYMTDQIITKHLQGSIEASNSILEYQSKSYKGAKFIITLPLKLFEE